MDQAGALMGPGGRAALGPVRSSRINLSGAPPPPSPVSGDTGFPWAAGSGDVSAPVYEGLRANAFGSGMSAPIPKVGAGYTDANGTQADTEGRINMRRRLDALYGTDAELAAPDPQDARYEALAKEAAIEELTPIERFGEAGRPPIRWEEERDRRALQAEVDLERGDRDRMGRELSGLEDTTDPAKIYQEDTQLHEMLMQDPRYSGLDEAKQKLARDNIRAEVERRRGAKRENIIQRYEMGPTTSPRRR